MKSTILAEDKDILVCYKPPGIAVQSARLGETDMVSELKNYLGGKNPYLGVVHRLDQPVSGILVFAKTPAAAAALSRQASHETGQESGKKKKPAAFMEKEYCALVFTGEAENLPEPGLSVKLEDYLLRDGRKNTSAVVPSGTKDAKRAELVYEVKEKKEKQALVNIRLLTGRHHQIRVQFAHAGLPLLGDARYGTEKSREYSAGKGITNICLCACRLSFYHPATGRRMDFQTEELPWIS